MDLSVSLGTPGRYDTPRFRECADQVIAAAKRHGKTAACLVTRRTRRVTGWPGATEFIIFSTDVILLGSAFRAGIDGLRGSPV